MTAPAKPAIRLHKQGEKVVFMHEGERTEGVCNGPHRSYDDQRPWVITHLPVYVREGDKCLYVDLHNIIEWNEAKDGD